MLSKQIVNDCLPIALKWSTDLAFISGYSKPSHYFCTDDYVAQTYIVFILFQSGNLGLQSCFLSIQLTHCSLFILHQLLTLM